MINNKYNATIYVQASSTAFGGAITWTTQAGSNRGYVRVLGSRERVSSDKPTLFSTHRAAMDCIVIPLYGNRLMVVGDDGTTAYYIVKLVNPQKLSGGGFQTVDCEVVQ
jgi:hypothetical protein